VCESDMKKNKKIWFVA